MEVFKMAMFEGVDPRNKKEMIETEIEMVKTNRFMTVDERRKKIIELNIILNDGKSS